MAGFVELATVIKGVKTHHEWYNGAGYPDGLSQKDIPLMSRIIGVADAYDAMTSERPYRKAKTRVQAILELQRCAGTQIDPKLVEIFVQMIKTTIYNRCFKCWHQINYEKFGKYLNCPKCGTKLFIGKLNDKIVEDTYCKTLEHDLLLQILHEKLSYNKEIHHGSTEIVIGNKIRHKPNAIYYYCVDKDKKRPVIYEVETAYSIFHKNTINQCRLFSETAKNCGGKFYLVIPKNFAGQDCKNLAIEMLQKNKIEFVEIITL